MTLKLGCYVCDSCRVVICGRNEKPAHARKGKKRELHYCSDRCLARGLNHQGRDGNLTKGDAR